MAEKADKPEVEERVPVVPANVREGHLMAFIYWGRVAQVRDAYGGQLKVEGVAGAPDFEVNGAALVRSAFSADLYAREERVSMTEAARILTTSYNRPFTVVFKKANGEERTLRGRLIHAEPLLGRSHVEDLDLPDGDNVRLVDHRTVKSLTVDNVRYVVK